jgi:hypothetical protein
MTDTPAHRRTPALRHPGAGTTLAWDEDPEHSSRLLLLDECSREAAGGTDAPCSSMGRASRRPARRSLECMKQEQLWPPPSSAGEPVRGLGVRLLGEGQNLPRLNSEHGGSILARTEHAITNLEMPLAAVLRLVGVGES